MMDNRNGHNPKQTATADIVEDCRIQVRSAGDVLEVQSKGKELAIALGFPPGDVSDIAAVAAELGRKVIEYAGSGEITLLTAERASQVGVIIVAQGNGRGLPRIEHPLLQVGASMDEFSLMFKAGQGTTVTAGKWLPGGTRSPPERQLLQRMPAQVAIGVLAIAQSQLRDCQLTLDRLNDFLGQWDIQPGERLNAQAITEGLRDLLSKLSSDAAGSGIEWSHRDETGAPLSSGGAYTISGAVAALRRVGIGHGARRIVRGLRPVQPVQVRTRRTVRPPTRSVGITRQSSLAR